MYQSVRLGFEVGSGRSVAIPVRHLCITGQTQEAGKTTALEALIARSEARAVTFITKRGESTFRGARRTAPYFREQADWQFVASILEASRGEKLKFERAWIIRASKGARTLADVHRNVKRALETAKGLSADVYLTLDAYLDAVVPAIAAVRWAPALELVAGVNAVDLTVMRPELQHLVIRSSIDWVLQKEEHTVVVIPEAWKFIPEARHTPVTHAVHALIRQGAALGNYVWLDSQDLGGVDKETLRSVPVWILGVQREANEIKRTLANIPAGIAKPTAAQIATLDLGQFFACWKTNVIRTYVQPSWLDELQAEAIACGRLTAGSVQAPKEETVDVQEANTLLADNRRLAAENEELRRRIAALENQYAATRPQRRDPHHDSSSDRSTSLDPVAVASIRRGDSSSASGQIADQAVEPFASDEEARYQSFKARLIAELPADLKVLQIVTSVPELRVSVERHVVPADGRSLRGRIGRLIADGFFGASRTSAQVLEELMKRGADRPSNIELGNEMKAMCDMGFFTRDNKWYTLVEGMKVNVVEAA